MVACVGRRVLGGGGEGGAEARWARAALAGAAVGAKRQADRAVAERAAALGEGVRAVQKRAKCGVLPFIGDFERWAAACERIFAGGRRADLDRWYGSLAGAMVACVRHAEHARTPRAVVLLENYHALHAALAALRVPALEGARRECRARYEEALRAYVTQYFGRPLEKLQQFFEGVSEAVAGGCREDEVCYRAAFSKHELRRVLALYPAAEVRRALHRLYRTVEKHLSEDGGLLQVVWRAMQEEFMAQHRALQVSVGPPRAATPRPAPSLTPLSLRRRPGSRRATRRRVFPSRSPRNISSKHSQTLRASTDRASCYRSDSRHTRGIYYCIIFTLSYTHTYPRNTLLSQKIVL